MGEKFTREQPRSAPITSTPILVEIDAEYVPLLFSALEKYHNKYYWLTPEDYTIGYQGVVKLERALLTDMSEPLINAIDRLTRYVDTAFNGTQYSINAGVVTPAIAEVPPIEPGNDLGGLRRRLLQAQGVTGGFFGIGAVPVTLADLLQAGRVNTTADQGLIADGLEEVLNTVGSGGSIATALTNLLGTGADVATDGGLAAVQIAAIVASQAQGALLYQQLDRLTRAIDGGGLLIPGDGDNNLLRYARAAAFDTAGETSSGQQLANIYERLGELALLLGEGNGPNLNARLEALQLQLSAIARIDDANVPVLGAGLELIREILNCICEGVTGTPTQTNFPPYTGASCNPAFTLQASGVFSFNPTNGNAFPQLVLENGATLQLTTVPGEGIYRPGAVQAITTGVAGPRDICIQVVRNGGAQVPSLTANLLPVRLPDGAAGQAATPSTTGLDTGGTVNLLNDSGNGEPLGYVLNIGAFIGEDEGDLYRVYISAGPVG